MKRTQKNKSKIILAVVALAIVAGAALTWLLWPAPVDYTYNNYPFEKGTCPGTEKTCYLLSIRGYSDPLPFENHPSMVEDVLFEYGAMEYLRSTVQQANATAIIGIPDGAPGEVVVAAARLSPFLGTRYGLLGMNVAARLSGDGDGKVDCRYATTRQYVILFEQGEADGVFVRAPNCVVVQGRDSTSVLRAVDAFSFRIMGIVPTYRPSSAPATLPAPPNGVRVNASDELASAN